MQLAERPSLTYRKWIAALVAATVVAILAIKAYGARRSAVPDRFDVSVLAAGVEEADLRAELARISAND